MPKETVPGNGPAPEKKGPRVDGRYFLLSPEQMEEQDRKNLTGDLDKVTDEMVTNLNRELSKDKKFFLAYGIDLENPAESGKTPNIFVLRDGKVTSLAESGIRPGSPEFWKTAMQGQLFGYQLGEKHPRQIQAWLGVSGLVFRDGNSLDPEKEDTQFPTEPQEPSRGAPPEMPTQPSSTNPAAQKNYAKQMSLYYLRRALQKVNGEAFGGQTARYQMEHSAWKRVNAQREKLRAARNNAAKQLSEQLGRTRTDEVLKNEAKEQKLQSSIEEAGRDLNIGARGIQNMLSVFGPTPYEQESWFEGQSRYAPGDLKKHLTPVDLTNRTLGKGEQERQVTAEDFGTLSLFSTLTRENGISLAKTSNPTMVDEKATAEAYRKMGFSEAEFLEIQKQNYLGVLIIDSFRPDSPRDPISARLPTVIEPARKNADAALQAYQKGDPGPLADIIARGIEYVNLATRTTTVMEETLVGLLRSASRLTDMMDRDPALKELASRRLGEMHAIYGQHPNVAPQNSMDEIIAKVRGYDKLLELKAKGNAARVKMLNVQAGKVTLTAEEKEECLRDMLTGDLTQELYKTQSDASRKVALSYIKPLNDQIARYETDPKLQFLTDSLMTTVQPFYTHKPDGEFILDAVNDPNAMKRVDDYVKRTVEQTIQKAENDSLKAFDAIRSKSIRTLSQPLESWTPAGRIALEAERGTGGFDPNDPPILWTDAAEGAREHMAKLLAYRTTFDVRNKPENMNKVFYGSDGKDDLGKQIDAASERLLDLLNKTFPQNADVQKLSAELEKDPTGAFIEQRLAQRIAALDTIPDSLPEALVFNAKDLVEALQEKLGDDVDDELTPATRRNFGAEMLAARILTDAKPGGEGLDRTVSVREFADKAKWVRDQMTLTYGDGSGGVKKLCADLERDPTGVIIAQKLGARLIRAGTAYKDVPRELYPSAKGTVEVLQEGLRKAAPAERQGFAADILAARLLVGAKRGGEGLDRTVDLAKLREKSALVSKLIDQAYGNDARGRDGLLALADSGHGGKMLERLTRRIAGMDRLPIDLPEGMSPTAKERIEAFQKKLKAQNSPQDKLRYTAEILAARAAVGAKRGGEGLTRQVGDVKKLEQSVQRYQNALKQLEPKDLTRLQQKALSGHGGEMTLEFQKLAPENAEPQAEQEQKQEPKVEQKPKQEPKAERKEEPKQEPKVERTEEQKQEPKAEQKRGGAALTVKDRLEALQKSLGAPEATLEGKRRCMAEMLAIRESVEKVETRRGKLERPFKNSDELTQRTVEFEQQLSQLTPKDLERLEQSGGDDLENSLTEYQDNMLFTYDNYLLPTILQKTIDNKAKELKSATDVQQRNRHLAAIILLGDIQDRLKPGEQRRSIRPEKLNEAADKLVGSKDFETFRSNPYYCAHCTIRAQEANAMAAIAFFSMSLTAQYKAVDEKDLAKLGRWANEIATGPKDKSTGPKDKSTGPKDKSTGPKDKSTGPKDKSTGPKDKSTGPKDKSTGPKDKSTGTKDITTETKHKTTGPKDKTTGEVAPAPRVL